jgi:hypothetical protein
VTDWATCAIANRAKTSRQRGKDHTERATIA